MRPVMQTKFFDLNAPASQQRGNCWTACIASLLELPIEEVPDFVQIDVDGGPNWFAHTISFLRGRGYRLANVDPAEATGYYYIQCGLSPRSPAVDGAAVHHAAVYSRGELAHDPYPGGTGVLTISDAYAVLPIDCPTATASTPVPQAVAGTVEPTAAPATRTDNGGAA